MPNAGTCDTGARYMLSSALDISANFMQVDIGRGMQGENNKEMRDWTLVLLNFTIAILSL